MVSKESIDFLEPYRELLVVIPCYLAVLFLVFWYIPYITSQAYSTIQSYSLAIDEDSTSYKIGNGKLTFILDNNQGGGSTLYMYGLSQSNNINQVKFFVSNLYDQVGSSIDVTHIVVEPKMTSLTTISETPTKVELTIQNSKELGKFRGWFMLLIGEEIISVPISASTDPIYMIALWWVTVGALISIGTWEFANFLDRLRTDQKFQILNSFSIENQLSIYQKKIKHDKHLGNSTEITRFSFVNFFTIVFGIAAFYLALLSKPEVMELQTISNLGILSLIGVGLGIGSLSGFINKP